MSVAFALPAAVTYGVADFAGGLAGRRISVVTVTAGAQFFGLIALLPAVLLVPGDPSAAALGIGALAGIAGARGCCCTSAGSPWGRWAWSRRCRPWWGRGCRC